MNGAAEASLFTNCMQVHVFSKEDQFDCINTKPRAHSDKQTSTTELDIHMQHKHRCAQMSEPGVSKNTFHSLTYTPTPLHIHANVHTHIYAYIFPNIRYHKYWELTPCTTNNGEIAVCVCVCVYQGLHLREFPVLPLNSKLSVCV